jgi:hypothetical protein
MAKRRFGHYKALIEGRTFRGDPYIFIIKAVVGIIEFRDQIIGVYRNRQIPDAARYDQVVHLHLHLVRRGIRRPAH